MQTDGNGCIDGDGMEWNGETEQKKKIQTNFKDV